MNAQDFDLLRQELLDECDRVLGKAAQEYATGSERFNNFTRAAEALRRNPRLKDITPFDVGLVYFQKHIDSIVAGVSLREDMRGRFVDAINYLTLLYGMYVVQRESGGPTPEPASWWGDHNMQRRLREEQLKYELTGTQFDNR